jgi:hypothetical protein
MRLERQKDSFENESLLRGFRLASTNANTRQIQDKRPDTSKKKETKNKDYNRQTDQRQRLRRR